MLIGRRFRVRFTPEQSAYSDEVAGICRAVWNTGLDQRRQYRQRRSWITYTQQAKEMAAAKVEPELLWLADAPGHCLQQTLMDLDRACRSHGTWKVQFRAKGKWSPSFRFPEGKQMRVQRIGKRWAQVNLPKFGQVRFRWTRDPGGQIRSATLIRDGVHGEWYLSLLVDDGIPEATPDPTLPAVGIDRGVVKALAMSDGRMLDQEFASNREQAAIVRLQQRGARQQGPRVPGSEGRKGRRAPSKRWLRTQARIAKKRATQRHRRDDFTAKAASTLTRTHGMIVVEKLQVASMTKRAAAKPNADQPAAFLHNQAAQKSGLNRAILGKGWGKFLLSLQHKARYTGTQIVSVPAAFTSQRCHQCLHVSSGNRKSQASFRCTRCGWHGNADTNAALNILAAGLAVTGRGSPDLSGGVNHQAPCASGLMESPSVQVGRMSRAPQRRQRVEGQALAARRNGCSAGPDLTYR